MAVSRTASDNIEVADHLRAVLAETQQIQVDMDVALGVTQYQTISMDLAVTDAPFIKIEPDRPRYKPFLVVDDLETL